MKIRPPVDLSGTWALCVLVMERLGARDGRDLEFMWEFERSHFHPTLLADLLKRWDVELVGPLPERLLGRLPEPPRRPAGARGKTR